jgi:hypothetical protein
MEGAQVVEQLAMAAGVPVLMLPPDPSEAMGTSIIAGWNGSREAARVVHEALPFLCGWSSVRSVRKWRGISKLPRRHGAGVQPQPSESGKGDAGEILLAQAAAHGRTC